MAEIPPPLKIHPPLTNTACPWATTLDDLRQLYECPSTGAVTTRTSLIHGFDHDPSRHQYSLFDVTSHASNLVDTSPVPQANSSINSLGYSHIVLATYLEFLKIISTENPTNPRNKTFIVSVTGLPEDIIQCYSLIAAAAPDLAFPVAMEINLSCPNIPNRPPPAYTREGVASYLAAIQTAVSNSSLPHLPVGIKTPPYTYISQYEALFSALEDSAAASPNRLCPLSFITATNTLGSCLVLSDSSQSGLTHQPVLPFNSTHSPATTDKPYTMGITTGGLGGVAGAPLHPLALGNVCTIRRMLDARKGKGLKHIQIIGVGGVLDAEGYMRMRAAGADVVGLATGLGILGREVFEGIERGLKNGW
ncbi:dihydroorotate dehydrogenase-like protein [Thermochaetoides thermophila DSM 1495]|uniref:Dihydroorotate dehydrogenase (fumarate) n=1 Tax=Chaetomium thermophilum (strain DSM 1495 / CBS 144.50 / IMI 039719) TaxID=759272 RepID=G0SEC3_CHATD|nr:dihydroorotate dehydrogenase-like protein [Thermochaetoides thermophila DSM 1495]EGS18300.1 dihydroorotate dehydrogenase-like protein [Thermochaetoides thermophila DSM 1495]